MDSLALLDEARAAGLKVRRDGDNLVVVGPEDAAPLVHQLAAHKADIFTALEQQPEDVCYFCGGPAVRGAAGSGAWTDGRTVFGVTVHTRCFGLMFPHGPRGDNPSWQQPNAKNRRVDALALIDQARAAGLIIQREGEHLVLCGTGETEEIERLVLENEAAVIENFCVECGEFIDRTGIGWAIIEKRPMHLPCHRIGLPNVGKAM